MYTVSLFRGLSSPWTLRNTAPSSRMGRALSWPAPRQAMPEPSPGSWRPTGTGWCRDGTDRISETNVGIPLGRRSVVGALDGPEAPYVFLVVEPSSARPLIVDPGVEIDPPRRVAGPPPSYTEEARKNRLQGVVVIQAVIGKDGRVSHTRVLKGLGMGLDRASEEAVSQWRFEPARRDGEPVAVFYNMTINFRLDDEEEGDEQDP